MTLSIREPNKKHGCESCRETFEWDFTTFFTDAEGNHLLLCEDCVKARILEKRTYAAEREKEQHSDTEGLQLVKQMKTCRLAPNATFAYVPDGKTIVKRLLYNNLWMLRACEECLSKKKKDNPMDADLGSFIASSVQMRFKMEEIANFLTFQAENSAECFAIVPEEMVASVKDIAAQIDRFIWFLGFRFSYQWWERNFIPEGSEMEWPDYFLSAVQHRETWKRNINALFTRLPDVQPLLQTSIWTNPSEERPQPCSHHPNGNTNYVFM